MIKPKVGARYKAVRRNGTPVSGKACKIEIESNGMWVTLYLGAAKRTPPIPENRHKDFIAVRPSQLELA